MKIEIGLDIRLRVLPGAIHRGHCLSHRDQFWLLDAYGRKRSNLRFENGAHFREMSGTFRLTNLDHQVERLAYGLSGAIGDESAAAGVGLDQALLPQSLHCFAHRSAAHAETLRQFAFCGELVAGLQIALDNGFFNLLNDLLVEPRRAN